MSKKISLETKDRVISKIKDEGLSVANSKADPSIMELSKLRRENAELKQIIGGIMLDSERGKKNR